MGKGSKSCQGVLTFVRIIKAPMSDLSLADTRTGSSWRACVDV